MMDRAARRRRNPPGDDDDGDTVSTHDLLDLIQTDVLGSSSSGRRGTGTGIGGVVGGGGRDATHARNGRDPFAVRLAQQSHPRRRIAPLSPSNNDSDDGSMEEGGGNGSEDDDSVGDMGGFASYKHYSGTSSSARANRRHGRANGNNGHDGASNKSSGRRRQRMPWGGGYGGMFDSHDAPNDNNHNNNGGEGSAASGDNDSTSAATSRGDESHASHASSHSSVFSFASRLFTRRRHRNPYAGGSQRSLSSQSTRHRKDNNAPWLQVAAVYLELPFRVRYFVQLFSIVGVFMLASLNYMIAMENHPGAYTKPTSEGRPVNAHHRQTAPQMQNMPRSIAEGGGMSPHQIPRLRVRDPLKFLHPDVRPNALLESATSKFRHSTRFGDAYSNTAKDGTGDRGGEGGGPFKLGWRSMPRQIFNDFATGLSDDGRTIQHAKNARHFEGRAKREVGFAGHEELEHRPLREGEGERAPPKGTVAYVLPITSCYAPTDRSNADAKDGPRPFHVPADEASFRDFAMLLRATIHAHSHRNPASGSAYEYEMHAIVHPRAKKCRSTRGLFTVRGGGAGGDHNVGGGGGGAGGLVDRTVVLQNLGYKVSVRHPPVDVADIRGSDYLRDHVEKDAGGGVPDLLRLYAYELEEYDAVALVDYDTLVLGPVDAAVDLIVDHRKEKAGGEGGDAANNGAGDGDDGIDAVFSWEHVPSSVDPNARASVVNLSFFLLRPSKATFQKLVLRYQNGPFSETRGWGSIGRGPFPGWMTAQGFLTYYYDEVASASRVEMSRCVFGNAGEDPPSDESVLITNSGSVQCGGSANGNNLCDACGESKLDDVRVAALSYCRAPWECGGEKDEGEDSADPSTATDELTGLCRRFRKAWFDGRLQMEDVHPQLEKGSGQLCLDGEYQPMKLLKPSVAYKPQFME